MDRDLVLSPEPWAASCPTLLPGGQSWELILGEQEPRGQAGTTGGWPCAAAPGVPSLPGPSLEGPEQGTHPSSSGRTPHPPSPTASLPPHGPFRSSPLQGAPRVGRAWEDPAGQVTRPLVPVGAPGPLAPLCLCSGLQPETPFPGTLRSAVLHVVGPGALGGMQEGAAKVGALGGPGPQLPGRRAGKRLGGRGPRTPHQASPSSGRRWGGGQGSGLGPLPWALARRQLGEGTSEELVQPPLPWQRGSSDDTWDPLLQPLGPAALPLCAEPTPTVLSEPSRQGPSVPGRVLHTPHASQLRGVRVLTHSGKPPDPRGESLRTRDQQGERGTWSRCKGTVRACLHRGGGAAWGVWTPEQCALCPDVQTSPQAPLPSTPPPRCPTVLLPPRTPAPSSPAPPAWPPRPWITLSVDVNPQCSLTSGSGRFDLVLPLPRGSQGGQGCLRAEDQSGWQGQTHSGWVS